MRNRLIIFLLAAVCGASCTDAYGQKWLKKLGKALDTATQILGTDDSKSTSSDAEMTTLAGGMRQTSIPGVSMKITKVEYWGKNVKVRFLMQNTSSDDVVFDPHDIKKAYDANGKDYSVDVAMGSDYVNFGGYSIPAGVSVKGFFEIKEVSRTVKNFKQLKASGNVRVNGKSEGFDYRLENFTVEEPEKNTNADNATCSLPSMYFSVLGCERDGQTVALNMTLKNLNEKAYTIFLNRTEIYDESGNSYNAKIMVNGSETGNYSKIKMEPGIPVNVVALIQNVSSSVSRLALARVTFSNDYYFEVKNQAITATSSSVVSEDAYPIGKADLPMWDLTGKVSKCVWEYAYLTRTYHFSNVGKWTKLDEQAITAQFKDFKRNTRGQITYYSGGDYDYIFSEAYTYNSAGRLTMHTYESPEQKTVTTYTLDDNGRVLGYVEDDEVFENDMSDLTPGKTHTVVSYTYPASSIDAKGNWTKRVAKTDKGDTWTETRTISYYQ